MANMTILDYANQDGMPLVETEAILNYVENNPIAAFMPFVDSQTGVKVWHQKVSLGGVGFRGYDENYTASNGKSIQKIVETKIYGGTVKVDYWKAQEKGPGVIQEALADKSEAAARYFLKMFFQGDINTQPRGFDGLNSLLTDSTGNVGYRNLISAGTNGGVLTMKLLDEALKYAPGRGRLSNTFIMGNYDCHVELTRLYRDENPYWVDSREMFGMMLDTYRGIPFIEVGTDETDTEILPFTETQGSSSVTTSMYIVRFDTMKGVSGLQNQPMNVLNPSLPDAADVVATYGIEHKAAICLGVPNAAIRIKGILSTN